MAKVTLVGYGLGNIQAFANIYHRLNIPVVIASNANQLLGAEKLILPGVGAFDAAMQVLNNSGMAKSLIRANLNKTPIFGICLGMQLLFEESEEGSEKGLGMIEGSVKKIIQVDDIKIPHMGWNETCYQNKSYIFTFITQYFYNIC